jgi:hypothetical protein
LCWCFQQWQQWSVCAGGRKGPALKVIW